MLLSMRGWRGGQIQGGLGNKGLSTRLPARRAMQQAAQIASSRKEEVREKKNKQQQQKK